MFFSKEEWMNSENDPKPWQRLSFRADPSAEEKIVFFSETAINRAVQEGRLPAPVAEELKEVLRRPGEIAAVYEWNGMVSWKNRQVARALLAPTQMQFGRRYFDSHGNPRSSGNDDKHFGGIH
jgi:hypothetical protein